MTPALSLRSYCAGVATRPVRITASDLEDRDHDHIVVTHGFAQNFVITTWLQVPVEAAGFASFATKPGAITHLRQDEFWRNRTLAALADIGHLATE